MYRIDLQSVDHWNNMLVWCNENFGEVKVKWGAINYGGASATFTFNNEEDLTLFKLNWVG